MLQTFACPCRNCLFLKVKINIKLHIIPCSKLDDKFFLLWVKIYLAPRTKLEATKIVIQTHDFMIYFSRTEKIKNFFISFWLFPIFYSHRFMDTIESDPFSHLSEIGQIKNKRKKKTMSNLFFPICQITKWYPTRNPALNPHTQIQSLFTIVNHKLQLLWR